MLSFRIFTYCETSFGSSFECRPFWKLVPWCNSTCLLWKSTHRVPDSFALSLSLIVYPFFLCILFCMNNHSEKVWLLYLSLNRWTVCLISGSIDLAWWFRGTSMFFQSIMADFLSLKNLKGKLAIITSWRCENALCLIYYFTIHTAFFFFKFWLNDFVTPFFCQISDQLKSRFSSGLSLPQICENLIKAAYDPRVSGIYLHIEPLNCGWGKVEEICRHILDFKKSGSTMEYWGFLYLNCVSFMLSLQKSRKDIWIPDLVWHLNGLT